MLVLLLALCSCARVHRPRGRAPPRRASRRPRRTAFTPFWPNRVVADQPALITLGERGEPPLLVRVGSGPPIEAFSTEGGRRAVQLPPLPPGKHLIQQSADGKAWTTLGFLHARKAPNWSLLWKVALGVAAGAALLGWRYRAHVRRRSRQKRSDEGARFELPR
jgi:hypothetical protein